MEKVIILSFVLLACVMCVFGTTMITQPVSTPTPTPSASSVPPLDSKSPDVKPEHTTAATKPTSGAVTVKAFSGLVMSVFLIALI